MEATQVSDDERVLELRTQGRSFTSIARTLGLAKVPMATDAFNRALRTRSIDLQQSLRRDEHQRLDMLAEHVRADAALTPETMARRLVVIDRMRVALDAE
ncbi:MAG TPA: hypothetical protein VGQ20_10580 [Acidimicrobiales bacterium]|nr:hypothetical protein [Acidimicrobiales bacterium]